mmetsp:Transcript_19498/g.57536  ORF Transcript_19498/g.57536 Transcript_19498/m.57536 type:complete len:620 (-) Transcript_19498:8-1867(-)
MRLCRWRSLLRGLPLGDDLRVVELLLLRHDGREAAQVVPDRSVGRDDGRLARVALVREPRVDSALGAVHPRLLVHLAVVDGHGPRVALGEGLPGLVERRDDDLDEAALALLHHRGLAIHEGAHGDAHLLLLVALHEKLVHHARGPGDAHVCALGRVAHVRAVQGHLENHLGVLRGRGVESVGRGLGHEARELVEVAAHVGAENHADHHLPSGGVLGGAQVLQEVVHGVRDHLPGAGDVHVLEDRLVVVEDGHLEAVLDVEGVVDARVPVVVHGRGEHRCEEVDLVHVLAHLLAHEQRVHGLRHVRRVDSVVVGHRRVAALHLADGGRYVLRAHSEVVEEVVALEDAQHQGRQGLPSRGLEEVEDVEVPGVHPGHEGVECLLLRGRYVAQAEGDILDVVRGARRGDAVPLLAHHLRGHGTSRGLFHHAVLGVEPLRGLRVEFAAAAQVPQLRVVEPVRANHIDDPVQVALVRRGFRAHLQVLQQRQHAVHGSFDTALELLVLHLLEALSRLVELVEDEEHTDDAAKAEDAHDRHVLLGRREGDNREDKRYHHDASVEERDRALKVLVAVGECLNDELDHEEGQEDEIDVDHDLLGKPLLPSESKVVAVVALHAQVEKKWR